jgi:hypothetical protein
MSFRVRRDRPQVVDGHHEVERPTATDPPPPAAFKLVEFRVRPYPYEPQLWETEIILDGNVHYYASEKNVWAANRAEAYRALYVEVYERWPHRISDKTVFKRA